jgi:hypothetical protein
MGGYGSGRRFGADCTDDYRSIDVRRWQREGFLNAGQSFNWQWSFSVSFSEDDCTISLA